MTALPASLASPAPALCKKRAALPVASGVRGSRGGRKKWAAPVETYAECASSLSQREISALHQRPRNVVVTTISDQSGEP